MKVCAISDLHGYLPEIQPCDLLLICGDIMPLNIQFNMPESLKWLSGTFMDWIEKLPVDQVVMVAGNHDAIFERSSRNAEAAIKCDKLKYLRNELFMYTSLSGNTLSIFGTPYCKLFGNWPFMRDPDTLKKKYSEIPEEVDILVSHDSPKIGEVGTILEGKWTGEDAGNKLLEEEIARKKPKYIFSGHIHSGRHSLTEYNGAKLYNVSIMNESYEPLNKPLYVEI